MIESTEGTAVASVGAPTSTYWVGADGNVWFASSSGVQNMGKPINTWDKGFDAELGSAESTFQSDPNAPPETTNNTTNLITSQEQTKIIMDLLVKVTSLELMGFQKLLTKLLMTKMSLKMSKPKKKILRHHFSQQPKAGVGLTLYFPVLGL